MILKKLHDLQIIGDIVIGENNSGNESGNLTGNQTGNETCNGTANVTAAGIEFDYVVDPTNYNIVLVESTNTVGLYSSIAIDSNDGVHISHHKSLNELRYCNNTASDGSLSCTVAKTTNFIGYYSSIAIDLNNKVHISHQDNWNFDLYYCNNTASDGSWSCIAIESTNNVGYDTSIAIDSNNKIHISHRDTTNSNLRYCNNTASDGSWSCIAVDSGGIYSSIAIDSNNKVHISHHEGIAADLRYCNNTASDGLWSCITIESTNNVGYLTSLAIDSNDDIHISHYEDIASSSSDRLRYCNNTASDGSWSCTEIASNTSITASSFGRGLAIKKGRLMDTTSYSTYVHGSFYNTSGGDLYYWNMSGTWPASSDSIPKINFTEPTPVNATSTVNTSFIVNVSIVEPDLNEVIYNWNGTNYTLYNDSLVLLMNFDNVSALGENDTLVADLSGYGNNGTGNSSSTVWLSTGKYGGVFNFSGNNNSFINKIGRASCRERV